jgi:hypothetical protein
MENGARSGLAAPGKKTERLYTRPELKYRASRCVD